MGMLRHDPPHGPLPQQLGPPYWAPPILKPALGFITVLLLLYFLYIVSHLEVTLGL